MKLQADYKKDGRWVQRGFIGDKYTWTVSGVAWNNIKERCTPNGATQSREPTYVGCKNLFKDFESFVEWHQLQIGYGLGYQLDSDILRNGEKIYSPETCVLIPPALNKFLQSYKGKRGKWPQGIYERKGRLCCRIGAFGMCTTLGYFDKSDVMRAVQLYTEHKNAAAKVWCDKLKNEYIIDPRVIDYMEQWTYQCDWISHE